MKQLLFETAAGARWMPTFNTRCNRRISNSDTDPLSCVLHFSRSRN